MTQPPLIQDLLNYWIGDYSVDPLFKEVHEESIPYDHRYFQFRVFKRLSDETYWSVNYVVQSSGDYNSFRDGDLKNEDVIQVYPRQITTTEYFLTP